MLQQTLGGIESAQADIEIAAALKQGDEVLKDLHEKVSLADWEELYENHEENLKMHDMEVEMFGEALNDQDLLGELDQLEADEAAANMNEPVLAGAISEEQAQKYANEHNEPAQPEPA